MTGLLAFVLRFLSAPMAERVLGYLRHRADRQSGDARVEADVEIETLRQAVEMAQVMSATETARYRVIWYWLFIGLFLVPLSLWWAFVLTYSALWCTDCLFPQTWIVAALPHPLDDWAAVMIGWLFLTTGTRLTLGGRR